MYCSQKSVAFVAVSSVRIGRNPIFFSDCCLGADGHKGRTL